MTLTQAHQRFIAEESLARICQIDEEQMRALADTMPQIVWSARADGSLDYYNERWYEFTGLERGAGGDESWMPILHPDDVQPCLEAWYRAVQTGEPYEREYRFREHRTGGYRWYLCRALPSKTATGRITRWFGTCTDIDKHKEVLRTLEQQTHALRAADRCKDEFVATLAHEIRNPLASIASASALLRTHAAEERGWAIEVIARQTARLTRLIDDLLDVARIGTGKIQLRKETLDLATVLDRAVESTSPMIRAKHHELSTDYPHGTLYLEADADRIEQMFVNLLVNAAKYTPPRGHLALRAASHGGYIEVVVQDDGVGIAARKLPKIFDLFMQGDGAATGAKDGLGLGLAIAQKMAELHGGIISAASAGADQGSQFTVLLPAGVPPSNPPLTSAFPGPSASALTRVLVVDDHVDSANGMARLLRRRGHEIEIAYDGPAAFEVAAAFRPEVVLLDLDLPAMDGCEVAARLRRDPAHRHCLLIALTGCGQEMDRTRCREAGFDHYLLKPVDLENLYGFISDFLAKGQRS